MPCAIDILMVENSLLMVPITRSPARNGMINADPSLQVGDKEH
ncbi:Uncharacterised protein [Vibrio cholerae]|nr:Uncharacterised protein [Vibrio cholerae]